MLHFLWRECRRIAWAWWRADRLRIAPRAEPLFEDEIEILVENDRI
jgi:hypothetical protein